MLSQAQFPIFASYLLGRIPGFPGIQIAFLQPSRVTTGQKGHMKIVGLNILIGHPSDMAIEIHQWKLIEEKTNREHLGGSLDIP